MPANSATELPTNDGPAIIMDKADHRQTASCGNSREAREYQTAQRQLVENGEFKKAFEMDVRDIQAKFGNKYDDAISQAREYINQLENKGAV